jgi:hypothetical protein
LQLGAQAQAYNDRFNKLKNKVTSRDVKSSPADLIEYQHMVEQHRAAQQKYAQKLASESASQV